MRAKRLLFSLLFSFYILYATTVFVGLKAKRWKHELQPKLNSQKKILERQNLSSFIEGKSLHNMTIMERDSIINRYLKQEGKKVYDCLMEGKLAKKCYSFKADVVYSKTVYRNEDMVMKYPHQYNLLINNPDACTSNTKIVIGTPVGPDQYLERMATRNTWGGVRNVNGIEIKHLFFVGRDENDPEGDRMLKEENDYYQDIIQFDMKNHYMNLTLLAILTYNWTLHYCSNIDYYVRADNDMWINPYSLVSELLSIPRKNVLLGYKITTGKPIRAPISRYYLSYKVFPNNIFDPYVSGCFLAMSYDVLSTVVKDCEKIGPIVYFDDVFLGQIARKSGIRIIAFPLNKMLFTPVAFDSMLYSKLWGIHRISAVDLVALWQFTM